MSNLSTLKKDFLAVGILYLITLVLFSGVAFKNEIFSDSGDTATAHALTQAGKILEENEQIEPQWFPYIFSGMPSFGSLMYLAKDVSYLTILLHFFGKIIFLGAEMSWMLLHFFLGAVGMYMFIRQLGLRHFSAFLSSLTILFCPFVIGLGQAGQGSKLMALSYVPFLLVATLYLFEKRNLFSLGVLAATVGTLMLTNHVQIVYYGFLIAGMYALLLAVFEIKNNPKIALTQGGMFLGALFIGFAIASFIYLSTLEYSQFSIRGGGEVGVSGGLNKDYATNWSFHPLETLTYFIPSFFGNPPEHLYWGWMPFNESITYIGIIPFIFLAFALVMKRNRTVVFFSLCSLVLLVISFGKHFFVYDLLFEYLPFFNKFRAPHMILLMIPITVSVAAAYGIEWLLFESWNNDNAKKKDELKKWLLVTIGVFGVLLLFSFALKSSWFPETAFLKEGDKEQYSVEQVIQLREVRFEDLKADFTKFALLSLVILGLIYFYIERKISTTVVGLALVIVFMIDLGILDKPYLKTFPRQSDDAFPPTPVVKFLQKDTSLYRIFPIEQFRAHDNSWMYFGLQTIGGYSPAKLKMYQEMVDSCLYRGWEPEFPLNMNIINMLNVKYLVFQGRLPEDKFNLVYADQKKPELVYENPNALPRAFFVDSVIVANKSETYRQLNSPEFNPRSTALIQKTLNIKTSPPQESSVKVSSFGAHAITFQTKNSSTSLLVISEIFYPPGWQAYIDGEQTEIYRTNSILRSLVVPAGSHTIEMKYESETYTTGLTLSYVGWGIALLLMGVGFIRTKKLSQKVA
ncbi:MAG: YfhO family protein, partial [Ignavibacteriales bacterium]|nr:YfhO family protein [Ignavibacteriales bacterium]